MIWTDTQKNNIAVEVAAPNADSGLTTYVKLTLFCTFMQDQQPALVACSWTSSGANQLPSALPPSHQVASNDQQPHTWIENPKTHNSEHNHRNNRSTSNPGHSFAHTPRIPELEPATAWTAGPGADLVPLLACWASCFVYVTVFSLERRLEEASANWKHTREWYKVATYYIATW